MVMPIASPIEMSRAISIAMPIAIHIMMPIEEPTAINNNFHSGFYL